MNLRRVDNLRKKIKARAQELNIQFESRPNGHWYGFGKPIYKSVTQKLSIIKDEGLMNWKMNRALEVMEDYLLKNTLKPYFVIRTENIPTEIIKPGQIIEQAKLAPQQEFEGAGDIGKAVHNWREKWFRDWMSDEDLYRTNFPACADPRPQVKASCEAIKRCITDLKAEPIACELRLADDKLEIGGTMDDLWAVPKDNKWEIYLIDLKTSNQAWGKDSYFFQVVLYWAMFRKLYKIKIDKIFILHTSKKNIWRL